LERTGWVRRSEQSWPARSSGVFSVTGGNYGLAEAFPDIITMDEPIKAAPMLLGRGFYSAVLSVAAGFTVAAIQSSPDATAG